MNPVYGVTSQTSAISEFVTIYLFILFVHYRTLLKVIAPRLANMLIYICHVIRLTATLKHVTKRAENQDFKLVSECN